MTKPPASTASSNASVADAITKLTAALDNNNKNKGPAPTPPKMGKMIEEDGVKVFEMGGIPTVDWTKLASETIRKHPGQIRSLDKTKTSRLFSTMPKLTTPWNKHQRLSILQKHVMTVAGNFGMQQNCYLKHPTKNEMINVIEHHTSMLLICNWSSRLSTVR